MEEGKVTKEFDALVKKIIAENSETMQRLESGWSDPVYEYVHELETRLQNTIEQVNVGIDRINKLVDERTLTSLKNAKTEKALEKGLTDIKCYFENAPDCNELCASHAITLVDQTLEQIK